MLTHRHTFLLTQIILLMLIAGSLTYAAADWRKQWPVRGPGGRVVATAVTPDGSRAATVTDDGQISLWDLPNRKRIRSKHLPQGKPIHLAIRNQGDAIAVAYEDADAVIWWCDGSDKLVRPSVDARLVAFAHSRGLLVTQTNRTEAWDIDTGDIKFASQWRSTGALPQHMHVLPSDRGVITHDEHIVWCSGFVFDQAGDIYASGSTSSRTANIPSLISPHGQVDIFEFDTSSVTFHADDPSGQQIFVESGRVNMFAPVCVVWSPGSQKYSGWNRLTTQLYTPVVDPSQNLAGILTGNAFGDLVIYHRAAANDWTSHPAPWLVFPSSLVMGWVMLKRRWQRLENPQPKIDPADAVLDMPRQTIVAAWIMVVIGVLAVTGMIYGLFVGEFTLRLDALAILAGIRIRQRRNGWRKFAAFLGWMTMAVGALMLGAALIGQQPLEFSLGSSQGYLPIWVGVLFSVGMLGLGVFLYLSLTNPQAQRICAAASTWSATRKEQRIIDLTRCSKCGYDITQTVLDGRRDCPECGNYIRYNPNEQEWVREFRARQV